MGQKIHPIGFRLAVNKNWGSRWYANSKNFGGMLNEDLKVREYLKKKLAHASVGRVVIERPAKDARITIYSARPGVVIGKKGEDIEALKAELRKMLGVQMVHVNIEEIRKPEIDAQLIADSIAQQLEKRIMFRRAMKRAMQNAMRLGAQGHQDRKFGQAERHRDRAQRMVPRGPRAAAYPARRYRLRLWRGQDHLRRDRHQGVGVQGRDRGQERATHRRARLRTRRNAVAEEGEKAAGARAKPDAASAKPEGEAKPKTTTRARKKPAAGAAAKDGESPKTEAKPRDRRRAQNPQPRPRRLGA